jgi:hypothetical protein
MPLPVGLGDNEEALEVGELVDDEGLSHPVPALLGTKSFTAVFTANVL